MSIEAPYLSQAEAALNSVVAQFTPRLFAAAGEIAHEIKPDNTPVTQLDKDIESAIRDSLSTIDTGVGFVGEEHGAEGNSETFWFIDPIDGTEQFIRGIPAYRMMATLVSDGQLQYAYVANLAKTETYTATRGRGAFCNGTALQVSERPLERSWIEFSTNLALPEAIALIPPIRQQTRGIRITGDFTHTPQGRFDGHLYYKASGSGWDWTPWALLIQEAGGRVANIGKPDYDYRDGNFLAANPVIFDGLKRIIDDTLAAAEA